MAIPKDLEGLVKGFTAEELTLFDNLLTKQATWAETEKQPKLAEGWLRQSDYDKNMNKWKTDVEKAEDLAKRREQWYVENKPIHDKALQEAREFEEKYRTGETQLQELQKQLEAAQAARAAGGEGDVIDQAELKRSVEAEVSKLGYVTKSEMASIIAEESRRLAVEEVSKAKLEATKELWEQTFPVMANQSADIAEVAYDHMTEFGGEKLDRTAFTSFLSERKLTDFKKGYEEFVKPRRDEKAFKQRVDEEVKQRMSGMTVNGGAPSGPAPMGALQQRLQKDQGTNSVTALAAQAAAELRAEGKVSPI